MTKVKQPEVNHNASAWCHQTTPTAHYKNPSVILIKSSLNEKSEAWASGKKRAKLIRHLAFYAFRALYIGVKPNEKSIENVQKT